MSVRRQVSPHAARLRRDATEVERRLWAVLRNRQLEGAKFRRQHMVGPFIVAACLEARLVIELDGGQHATERDAARTAFLTAARFEVVRFWNNEVGEDLEGVVAAIAGWLRKKALTQPSPAKAGEG